MRYESLINVAEYSLLHSNERVTLKMHFNASFIKPVFPNRV